MTINDIRGMFPALQQQVYGHPLVYFDNAATSQRLASAIRRMDGLALGANANIHRAVHKLASDAEELNNCSGCSRAASLIMKSDGGQRSFKVEVASPEGMSYARDIAKKYGVTYEMLTGRKEKED